MARIVLTDGSGRWFDGEKAEKFEEATRWNGQNNVSLATGDQFLHEVLYRTSGGRWILHSWSQWQGSSESYEEIDNDRAAIWLVTNKHEAHESCRAEVAALEIE
jgi:hypothetical protein